MLIKNSLLLFILFVLIFLSCKKDTIQDEYLNQSYGSHERNKLDIRLPDGHNANTPMVILIHGGGWIGGDKNDMASFANLFTLNGIGTAAINYRYANGADITYEDLMVDIGYAIAYLNGKSGAYLFSMNRPCILGYSAGGHMAMLYAHAYDANNKIGGITSMVGPADLTDSTQISLLVAFGADSILWDLMGSSIPLQQASPIYRIGDVPTQYIYGQLDNLVPYQPAKSMYDSLQLKNIDSEWILFNDADHNVYGTNFQHADSINKATIRWVKTYGD